MSGSYEAIYTCTSVQKFGVKMFFVSFLKEVLSVGQRGGGRTSVTSNKI